MPASATSHHNDTKIYCTVSFQLEKVVEVSTRVFAKTPQTCKLTIQVVTVFASGVVWTIKNPNRDLLFSASVPRKKANIVPWPGTLPTSFTKTRAVLLGGMSKSKQLELSDELLSIVILEYVLELCLLQYPVSTIRAILHAIPNLRACHFARRVFIIWTTGLAAMAGSRGKGKSYGSEKGGGSLSSAWIPRKHSGNRERTPLRRKKKNHRRDQSSSSGSSSRKVASITVAA